MTHYEKLKKHLAETPYIVGDADTGDVRLVDEPTARRYFARGGPFRRRVMLNLEEVLERFAELPAIGKEDKAFALKDIAEMAGMEYMLAYTYYKRGIFNPSVRPFGGSGKGATSEARFSWGDAFVAGTVGSLWRHRIPIAGLAKVRGLLEETKQTDRELVTPNRS
jgi:hypothetical protein